MISINELSFCYTKKEPLFSGLSLDMKEGNIYGLLGKNGAGKTTLLKIIGGLLFPQLGTCTVSGYESKSRKKQLLEEIYFIPEEFYLPPLTADHYISLYAPFYPAFDREVFNKLAADLELLRDKRLSAFSYGQKKKFLIAFGIATQCKLLILDEPTNGLDIPSKSQFRKILASSITEDRLFIISTHQARDIANLIDPIIIIDEGSVIFNQDSMAISEKLKFRLVESEPDPGKVLLSEKTLGGYGIIEENNDQSETRIDLELLFNTVINNKERIRKLFSTGKEVDNEK